MSQSNMRHGTSHAYDRGCRCEPCKAAYSAYRKAWRARRTDGYRGQLEANRRWREHKANGQEIAPFYRFLGASR
jgi:hypothetical protein